MAKAKKKSYQYYIVYQAVTRTGQNQITMSVLDRNHPIDSVAQVQDVIQYLRITNELQSVIPINWIRLGPMNEKE